MSKTILLAGDAGTRSSDAYQTIIQYNALLSALWNSAWGSGQFGISSNFDVTNAQAILTYINGLPSSVKVSSAFDTGTTAIITADKWGIAILTWDGTTPTVTWASTGATHMAYASEAAAIAALGTGNLVPATGFVSLGYVTVLTGSGVTWTAGTDALAGGSGGTAATTTHYVSDPSLGGEYGVAAVAQLANSVRTVITV